MDYLKPKQYYINLYDLFTIKDCLRTIKISQEIYQEKIKTDQSIKDTPLEEIEKGFYYFLNLELLSNKTSRYKRKQKTIQEWMDRDKNFQEKFDNTSPPSKIFCTCKAKMKSDTFKTLEGGYDSDPIRVLFFFSCPKCKKREAFYDNGEQHQSAPILCPKCKSKTKTTHKKKGGVLTTTEKCTNCDHVNIDIYDSGKRQKERERSEKNDQELLKKYRDDFCLSDEDGKKYIDMFEAMEVASEVYDETLNQYDSPARANKALLNMFPVSEIESLLNKGIRGSEYSNLLFKSPEIKRYVNLPFTIQDNKPKRRATDSISKLYQLFKNLLKDTNWRLSKDSLDYRLGIITGTLRGYETDDDLLKLVGKEEVKKRKTKLDPKKKEKYLTHSYVQLAKLSAKIKATENIRKRRLENEPDGFVLNASEGPYSCGVCGNNHYGDEVWWNLEGIRCLDCRNNILKQKIRLKGHRYDKDSNWFADWQVKSDYGVHPATRKKLRREGVLKGHDFKDDKDDIYFTVYLINENKKFLDNYKKVESKFEVTTYDSTNNKVKL